MENILLNTGKHEFADVSFLFGERTRPPVHVHLNERMYSIKRDVPSNWVWHAFRGFEILKRTYASKGLMPKTFAAVGSGSGIDAIGAVRIFNTLKTIIVTDVESDVVKTAAENVRRNVPSHVEVIGLAGDVCLPIAEAGLKVDIAYANLPNIPVSSSGIIDHGTFYKPSGGATAETVLNDYLLGLQCRFLNTARHILAPRGEVAFMIGGRFPLRILDRMASVCAFRLREVLASLKIQTEAENVTLGYAEWERNGISFDFYDFELASHLLGFKPSLTGSELKEVLSPAVMTATIALERVRSGHPIGHTLHMMAGHPAPAR